MTRNCKKNRQKLPEIRHSAKQTVLLLFLGAWTLLQGGDLLRLEQSLDAMGSVYTVVAYGEDRAKMIAAVDQAFEEVRRLDRMLSNYRRDSELSRLNRDAASGPVHVSDSAHRAMEILTKDGIESAFISAGFRFRPVLLADVSAWDFDRQPWAAY